MDGIPHAIQSQNPISKVPQISRHTRHQCSMASYLIQPADGLTKAACRSLCLHTLATRRRSSSFAACTTWAQTARSPPSVASMSCASRGMAAVWFSSAGARAKAAASCGRSCTLSHGRVRSSLFPTPCRPACAAAEADVSRNGPLPLHLCCAQVSVLPHAANQTGGVQAKPREERISSVSLDSILDIFPTLQPADHAAAALSMMGSSTR